MRKNMRKMCMLEENKICDNCCECNTCDLNPQKICDNCAKCIDTEASFRAIEITDIIALEDDLKKKLKLIKPKED